VQTDRTLSVEERLSSLHIRIARRWTAQGMPTHPLTASIRRVAMATEIEVFQPVLRELKDALVLARHRMLVALASPGLIDKAAAAPVMTTLVG
jgi:hypothetical protein